MDVVDGLDGYEQFPPVWRSGATVWVRRAGWRWVRAPGARQPTPVSPSRRKEAGLGWRSGLCSPTARPRPRARRRAPHPSARPAQVAVIGMASSISPVTSCSFFNHRRYSSSSVSGAEAFAALRVWRAWRTADLPASFFPTRQVTSSTSTSVESSTLRNVLTWKETKRKSRPVSSCAPRTGFEGTSPTVTLFTKQTKARMLLS